MSITSNTSGQGGGPHESGPLQGSLRRLGETTALRRLSLGVPQHDVVHPAVLRRPRDVGPAATGGEWGDGGGSARSVIAVFGGRRWDSAHCPVETVLR